MKKLVQFRMGGGIQIIENLKQELDFSSRAEVIRLSLNLLNWIIDYIKSGYEITAVKNKGKFERIRIPFLELRILRQENSQGKVVKKKKKK